MNKELLKYFKNDTLAAQVWLNKYAQEGDITPDDMHKRMAKEFARVEQNYPNPLSENEIYNLFKDFKYVIPGGSIMSGLGSKEYSSLSNCTVISPPEDNYESIMDSRKFMVQLSKRRCGVGMDLSKLRPKNTPVTNSAKTSTGAVSFMQGYSDIASEVAQGGRRAALMLSMDINHPDIEDFIESKQDLTKITGANISVMVSDEFMEAVEKDEDYILRFPIDQDLSYFSYDYLDVEYNQLVCLEDHKKDNEIFYIKKVKAKKLWDKLMYCAWNTAEPGIIFKDRINNYSPDGVYPEFKMVGLNPCAEQSLGAEDSCRLLHINLTSFVDNPFTEKATFDFKLYADIVQKAVRLGDDIVDLEIEHIDRILDKIKSQDGENSEYKLWEKFKQSGLNGRRIGLGFTGLADTIAMLNLSYNNFSSSLTTNSLILYNIMIIKFRSELNASIHLAKERGPFEHWDREKEFSDKYYNNNIYKIPNNDWYEFVYSYYPELYNEMVEHGRRNLSISTVAPVGTVSLMTQTSSGIEPVFMPFYERRVKCNNEEEGDFIDNLGVKYKTFIVVHPKLKEWARANWKQDWGDEPMEEWSMGFWQDIFKESPYYGSTAQEIDWRNRIKLQSVIQRYTSNAISSTINLHKDTTQAEIQDLYIEAWKDKLKGITIYRDGCRNGILTSIQKESPVIIEGKNAPKRPKELEADFYQIKVKGEQFIVLVGLLKGIPYEIFTFRPNEDININNHKGIITKIKKGKYSFDSSYINITDLQLANEKIEENAATLYTSMLLRHGIPLEHIIKTAKKVNENITSFSSAMCRILSKYIKDGETGEVCPECNSSLVRESGCIHCPSCGWSKCG